MKNHVNLYKCGDISYNHTKHIKEENGKDGTGIEFFKSKSENSEGMLQKCSPEKWLNTFLMPVF